MKKIISYLFIIITVLSFIPEYKTSASYEYETPVVFIHGYNSSVNMWKDTGFYKEFGKVYLVDYRDLARNDITSTEVRKRIQKQLDFAINDSPNGQTDVVVHSMGGLAIRYFLSLDENKEYREKIRQIVFLATPNRGSKVAFSGRLADIIANPGVYGISEDKLSRYSESYRKYKEFLLSEYTERKIPSFEEWLKDNNIKDLGDILLSTQTLKDNQFKKSGTKDELPQLFDGTHGSKVKSGGLPYKYSKSFEQLSYYFVGQKQKKIDNYSPFFHHFQVKKDTLNKVPFSKSELMDEFVLFAELNTTDGDSTYYESSAGNIVMDRLMSESFHVTSTITNDKGLMSHERVISNPFLYELNIKEQNYRANAIKKGKSIPAYITVAVKTTKTVGNLLEKSVGGEDKYNSYKNMAFATETSITRFPFLMLIFSEFENRPVYQLINEFTDFGVWGNKRNEYNDIVVPYSNVELPKIGLDKHIALDEELSHTTIAKETEIVQNIYYNIFTTTDIDQIIDDLSHPNSIIFDFADYYYSEEPTTIEGNPILFNKNITQSKNEDGKYSPINFKIETQQSGKVIKINRDRLTLGWKEYEVITPVYNSATQSYMAVGKLETGRDVEDYIFIFVNEKYNANKQLEGYPLSNNDMKISFKRETKDDKEEIIYPYGISPMTSDYNKGKVTHKYKIYQDSKTVGEFSKNDFEVYDNGEKITNFDLKVNKEEIKNEGNVVLALDYSNSMREGYAFERSKKSAEDYMKTIDKDINLAVVGFADSPKKLSGFTKDYKKASRSVYADIGGGTGLYDTIKYSSNMLSKQEGQRSLILMSDGDDDGSTTSLEDAIKIAKRHKVKIYPIALGGYVQPEVLQKLANETGGYWYNTPNVHDLGGIYGEITTATVYTYEITYNVPKVKVQENMTDIEYDEYEHKATIQLTNNRSNMQTFTYLNQGDYKETMKSRLENIGKWFILW